MIPISLLLENCSGCIRTLEWKDRDLVDAFFFLLQSWGGQ